jgi:hypothetical protein
MKTQIQSRPILLFNDECAVCRSIAHWVQKSAEGEKGGPRIVQQPIGDDRDALRLLNPDLDIWDAYETTRPDARWLDETWWRSRCQGSAGPAEYKVVRRGFHRQDVWIPTVSGDTQRHLRHPCGCAPAVRLRELRRARRFTAIACVDQMDEGHIRRASWPEPHSAFHVALRHGKPSAEGNGRASWANAAPLKSERMGLELLS